MKPKKSIEFFMMLTNRSVYLAKYTVKSYHKVYEKLKDKYDIQLTVYLNSINYSKYENNIRKLSTYSFVVLRESATKASDFIWKNDHYLSKSNGLRYTLPMERMSEGQDIAYKEFQSDYIVTVDDDFEVLNPDFIEILLNKMEETPNLGVISTERTQTHKKFDNYSQGYIIAQERNDTWFCMYKQESKVQGISMELLDKYICDNGDVYTWSPNAPDKISWKNYYEITQTKEGDRYSWDGAALLQEEIRKSFNHPVISLSDINPDLTRQYVHYAGFGKNVSVNTPIKVFFYRYFYLRKIYGISVFPDSLNQFVKKVYRKLFKVFFEQSEVERKMPTPTSKLD